MPEKSQKSTLKNKKYFDQSENIIEKNEILVVESKGKGDAINSILRRKIEKMKNLPNYDAIIEKLDETRNKLLEESYEVIEDDDEFGFLLY